jgi:hypothetical protein
MSQYIVEWLHHYAIHFGAWVCFLIAATVHKSGIPDAPDKTMGKALFLAAILSIFSSFSHNHYLSHFVK